jgi:hypothetical protein|tara:strand:+ start:3997 stop:4893 length:897 start_codon:yes stop_codon:yes gene_type:complete
MSDDKTKKSIKKKITNTVKKAVKKVKGAPKRATWKMKKALANKQAINYETKSGKPLHLVRASLGYRNNTTAKNQETEMLYRLAKMNLNNLKRGGLQNFTRKPKEKNMELLGYNYYKLSRYRDSHDKINTISIPKKKQDALRKKLETKLKKREKELDKINVNAWVKAARNRANIEKRKVSAIKSINSLPKNMQEVIKQKYKEGEFKNINNILAEKNTNKLFIHGHPNASKKLKSLMFREIQAKRPNLPNLPPKIKKEIFKRSLTNNEKNIFNNNKKKKNQPKHMYNHTNGKHRIIKQNT